MNLKKLGTLVIAIIMTMTVGLAFAATDTYSGSNQVENTGDITGGLIGATTIPLTKSIVLFNTDGSEIREPNISFSYAVTPVDVTDGDITVTDDGSRNENDPVTVAVYDGIDGAFTSGLTLTFADTNSKVAAAKAGTELEKTGNLTVNVSAFTHAGIYRYLITETPNPTDVTLKGLDERTSAYNNTRYLDVYIKNGTNGLEMYGAVIFQTTTSQGGDVDTDTTKTTGFEPSDSSNYEGDNTVDKYHTFNLEVNKTITGGLADLGHDFPFEITLTGDKEATIITDYSKSGSTYAGTEPTTVAISTTAQTVYPKMSNGDSVTITGIPVGTTVQVKETNDTYDKYTASLTTQTGLTDAAMTTTALDRNDSIQLTSAVEITDKTQKSVLGLTNNLAEVSPTGVVLRFAPYALMLAAGIVLLVLSKKRRSSKED